MGDWRLGSPCKWVDIFTFGFCNTLVMNTIFIQKWLWDWAETDRKGELLRIWWMPLLSSFKTKLHGFIQYTSPPPHTHTNVFWYKALNNLGLLVFLNQNWVKCQKLCHKVDAFSFFFLFNVCSPPPWYGISITLSAFLLIWKETWCRCDVMWPFPSSPDDHCCSFDNLRITDMLTFL